MNLAQIFNTVIEGEQIKFETVEPYKRSLLVLLKDYYCKDEIFYLVADTMSPYFWVPNEITEDEYYLSLETEEEQEYFLETCLGSL